MISIDIAQLKIWNSGKGFMPKKSLSMKSSTPFRIQEYTQFGYAFQMCHEPFSQDFDGPFGLNSLTRTLFLDNQTI